MQPKCQQPQAEVTGTLPLTDPHSAWAAGAHEAGGPPGAAAEAAQPARKPSGTLAPPHPGQLCVWELARHPAHLRHVRSLRQDSKPECGKLGRHTADVPFCALTLNSHAAPPQGSKWETLLLRRSFGARLLVSSPLGFTKRLSSPSHTHTLLLTHMLVFTHALMHGLANAHTHAQARCPHPSGSAHRQRD